MEHPKRDNVKAKAELGGTFLSTAASKTADWENVSNVQNARCSNHPELLPVFMCASCGQAFCRSCLKVYGHSSGGVCSSCGGLCLPFESVKAKALLLADQQTEFGLHDFFLAIASQFRAGGGLLFTAVFYGACNYILPLFAISAFASILGLLGLLPALIANALLIGCTTGIIRHVENGGHNARGVADSSLVLVEFIDHFFTGIALLLCVGWPWLLSLRYGHDHQWIAWPAAIWSAAIYPLALSVACRSQSFWETVNPFSSACVLFEWKGISVRFYLMYAVVLGATVVIVALALPTIRLFGMFTPMLPVIGVFAGAPIFYANCVIAVLIGRAFFKSGTGK